MKKQNNSALQRPAPKTPITHEAVQRVQRITAAKNGGQQGDWTRRLQSTADKRAAATTPAPNAAGANGPRTASGQRVGKAARVAKSAGG